MKQTNPHGDPVHWDTNTANKIWLRNHLCLRWKESTSDRQKVTGLQLAFQVMGLGLTTAWRSWRERAAGITGDREKWQFGVPQSKCWWSMAFVNISPRPADLAAASDKQGVRLMVIRPSGQREWKREWIVLPSQLLIPGLATPGANN